MKKVIIAEKPSLGRAIASAFFNIQKGNGYLYNDDLYITWAYGHLFELQQIEDYLPQKENGERYYWNELTYPFIPKEMKYKLKNDTKDQFDVIKSLINRNDVDEIISAGDADREGEVIIRLIIKNGLMDNKKLSRLWLPDQTLGTVRQAFQNREALSHFDNLYNEGLARSYIDWLVGINLTREVSVKSGVLYNIGRVVTPIVQAIYTRDMEIKNFIPKKYYAIESKEKIDNIEVKLASEKKFSKDEIEEANSFANRCNNGTLEVIDVIKKETKKGPGKLFSLSKLQGIAGKQGFSPANTLDIVQSLYEKGYVTYPRTNTEYLSENEKDKISNLIDILKMNGWNISFKDTKSIFDDSKIESHSALTPTNKFPAQGDLSKAEQEIYDIIFNRFISMFYAEDCVLDVTTVKLLLTMQDGAKEEFKIKGSVLKQKGWTTIEKPNFKDNMLPKMEIGDIILHNFIPTEKETTPPKKYTVDSLNEYLKHPFKKEQKTTEDEEYKDILEGVEIGTEATRAGIIDKAIVCKYISLSKNTYSIEEKGIKLIDILNKLKLSLDAEKTVEMQKLLKKVYKGEITSVDAVNWSIDFLKDFFAISKDIKIEKETYSQQREKIANCPLCRSAIYENSKGFACSNKECGLTIWKKEAFLNHFGKTVTKNVAKDFFEKGSHKFSGMKGKKGTFSATVQIEIIDSKNKKFSLKFDKK